MDSGGQLNTDPRRIISTRGGNPGKGPVIYWMSRDQRVRDNWALLFARQLAFERKVPLAVVFTLSNSFLGAARRQYEFMLKGLEELESSLLQLRIPFYLLMGEPPAELAGFAGEYKAATVVSDFDPLRIKRQWKQTFLGLTDVTFHTVDAHNIVPAFHASDRQEFGAFTFRPKINRQLEGFLTPFPEMEPMPGDRTFEFTSVDWQAVRNKLRADESVPEVNHPLPGERAARSGLQAFMHKRLAHYAARKNDPNASAVSGLSPYLHFGQISAQRVALEVLRERPGDENTASFLEELIVRRELSDNYCLFNPQYDNLKKIPAWAAKTLEDHRRDEREFLYDRETLEAGRTHESLWNAAQREMMRSGKMHGYMRMYWAKKILEWTPTAEEAMATAVYLNDRYQLDGRDPNGYTGCAWSIAGVHDRAWAERPVFGKIRYMNEKGCRRKFDADAYIRKWL